MNEPVQTNSEANQKRGNLKLDVVINSVGVHTKADVRCRKASQSPGIEKSLSPSDFQCPFLFQQVINNLAI